MVITNSTTKQSADDRVLVSTKQTQTDSWVASIVSICTAGLFASTMGEALIMRWNNSMDRMQQWLMGNHDDCRTTK